MRADKEEKALEMREAIKSVTPPQRRLLLRMHQQGPKRLHRVGEMGSTVNVLGRLVRHGLAEYGLADWRSDYLWWGRLTAKGRAMAKAIETGGLR